MAEKLPTDSPVRPELITGELPTEFALRPDYEDPGLWYGIADTLNGSGKTNNKVVMRRTTLHGTVDHRGERVVKLPPTTYETIVLRIAKTAALRNEDSTGIDEVALSTLLETAGTDFRQFFDDKEVQIDQDIWQAIISDENQSALLKAVLAFCAAARDQNPYGHEHLLAKIELFARYASITARNELE